MTSNLRTTTPRQDGFRMPGEFEPHAGCWMLFPERPDVWSFQAKPAQKVFTGVATAISQFEPVTVCASTKSYLTARELMPTNVRVVEMSSNDAWMRDCGPTFLVNDTGEVRGIDWEFNAWGGLKGGLYHPWDQDNLIAQKVLDLVGADRYKTSVVNEGGAIHVDGDGTLITTRSVLLNENRNPDLTETEVEQVLQDYLNVEKVIWLDTLALDETDGHVDGVCAFVRPGVLLLSWTDDKNSPEYDDCRIAYEQLRAATDAKGRSFEIIKLPLGTVPPITAEEADAIEAADSSYPRPEGESIWSGYINFYIANGGVVFPLFNAPEDKQAHEILQKAFPDRKVVGVPGARQISMGGGNIHCITQQQPLGRR